MKRLDHQLQRLRVVKALRHIPKSSRVLDVGCANGRLFTLGRSRIIHGIGLDLDDSLPWLESEFERIIGEFPSALPDAQTFDVITMLAVLEHLPEETLLKWARESFSRLVEGGLVIITIPSPAVDRILAAAIKLKILDGMDAESHHGCSPARIEPAFTSAGFSILTQKRFQFGLNNLLVFEKITGPRRNKSS
jgi:SAM-dependent methyltransferase